LEQDGGEPHEPESTSEDQDDPSPPAESEPAEDRPRRLLVVGGVIAIVGVVAAISYSAGDGGDLTAPTPDDDIEITLPSSEVDATSTSTPTVATSAQPTVAPTTVAPTTAAPTTAAPTTAAPTTAAPTTAAPTTASPTTRPGGGDAPTTVPSGQTVSIESIVPDIAASRRYLATPQQVQTTVDRLLQNGGRHDVAVPGDVATICATVELAGPIELSARWERDGEVIAETGVVVLRTAPGFGDCIDNEGEPLEPGSYQFIATDVEGTDSAVANFVVGAARIDQQFVNDREDPVCAILVAPTSSDFFEDYVFGTPLPPRSAVVIPIADVPQDVEVRGCGEEDEEAVADFDFDPTPGQPRSLVP
jgi:hypothetical protein